jgi:hypothetical protein
MGRHLIASAVSVVAPKTACGVLKPLQGFGQVPTTYRAFVIARNEAIQRKSTLDCVVPYNDESAYLFVYEAFVPLVIFPNLFRVG